MSKQLDLHGIRHTEVERLVENLVLLNNQWKIIAGNSDKMIKVVEEKLDWLYNKHGVEWCKPTHNTFSSI